MATVYCKNYAEHAAPPTTLHRYSEGIPGDDGVSGTPYNIHQNAHCWRNAQLAFICSYIRCVLLPNTIT